MEQHDRLELGPRPQGSRLQQAWEHIAAAPNSVAVLITLTTSVASALTVAVAREWPGIVQRPGAVVTFVAVAIALQFVAVDIYGHGAISFGGTGLLALGFALGPAAAMAGAIVAAAIRLTVSRGRFYRAVFDAAQLAVAAGCATLLFRAVSSSLPGTGPRMLLATAAGLAFLGVNLGLLTIAMSLEEHRRPGAVWRERFRWVIPYGVAAGPLAYGLLVGYERFGPIAVLVFSLPPASMMLSVRQYLARTQQSLEDVRQANAALEHANTALAVRNEDLRELFEFAGGLATRAGSRFDLVRYVEDSLTRIAGATVRVDDARNMIEVRGEATAERWNRLSDLIVPQVATALERLELLEKVRRTHVATIAALSRSMEAKDGYTGGHTERVTAIAVALARRLGYAGEELDAIETGALMHDIGKIGIPERILHKPSALDDEEWAVMRKHPVISDYILSGIDLPAEVRQIVRSSHERIDGQGYPDGLAGSEIPLPARIVFVADAFDALTSDRPYRAPRSTREALREIRANAGTQFCAAVVAALEQVAREEPGLIGTPPPLRAVRVA